MSRTYIGDTDIVNPSGVTITYLMKANKNCKYCLGMGVERFLVADMGKDSETKERILDKNPQCLPCRCIKLVKKESTNEPR
jgi:hypothetical protein